MESLVRLLRSSTQAPPVSLPSQSDDDETTAADRAPCERDAIVPTSSQRLPDTMKVTKSDVALPCVPRLCAPQPVPAVCTTSPPLTILVVGAARSGKSSLINAYRGAVVRRRWGRPVRWPSAPVGCPTLTVEPYPDDAVDPSWICIDTPGRMYDMAHDVHLARLIAGPPWRTRLCDADTTCTDALPLVVPAHRAHQCLLVVPATDLVRRATGTWWGRLTRRAPACAVVAGASEVAVYVRHVTAQLGCLLHDRAPFVVVTKMDLVGGTGASEVRGVIAALLNTCVPHNHLFFCAAPYDPSWTGIDDENVAKLDAASRAELVRLHAQLSLSVLWARRVDADAPPREDECGVDDLNAILSVD